MSTYHARDQWQAHRLDAVGANILLGQCAEYDLGNMCDPAYTMVCQVAKRSPSPDDPWICKGSCESVYSSACGFFPAC